MYSSRGGNAYGQQQPYGSQSAYSQGLGPGYGSSAGGPDGASQLSLASRHQSMLGGPQESDGYRGHPSGGAHYGGQYSSLYVSAQSGQQVSGIGAKGVGPSTVEGRSVYGSAMPDSPKFTSGDYISASSHGYRHKSDQLFADKISDHTSIDKRQYGDRQSNYAGTTLQNVPPGRYGDSISFGHQHQPDMYDRMDQASLLRREQMLKAQSVQSASLDGGNRQADYLAAMGASTRHPTQDLMSYGGKMDADPRSLSLLSGSSYDGQHTPSILGAAPRRNVEDLMYAPGSSNPGYGVSLPPGRDYATGKGLHAASLDSDFPGSLLTRGSHSRIDERKDDRSAYARELERKEEERRRELLREREKVREREKERERERERDRERERERERERRRTRERERERILERREKEKEKDRERERGLESRRDRTPPRISRDRAEWRGSSLTKDARTLRRDSPRHDASHRHHSPVKEKRREYICKVHASSLVDVERDYLSLDKRYPRLFISPECAKVVVNWPRENLRIPIHTPVSFEHDFIEEDAGAEQKEPPAIPSVDEPAKSKRGPIVWKAKMILMSGLSQNALEELSSDKIYNDRIPHFCNMLRFAVLRKDNSFMAIGGPWDSVDGGDPMIDGSSLVQTVLRYAKDVTQLDLKNCKHWNRFLEIHYDRVGKDGLFSHKEVTVLYVPELSDCLPSLEAWRGQWLAHKKDIAARERQHALKKEKSREKDEVKDKEINPSKEVKESDKSEKKVEAVSPGQVLGAGDNKDGESEKPSQEKNEVKTGEEVSNVEKNELKESAGVSAAIGKPGKKKIIKKIVKQKVSDKKDGPEDPTKQCDELEEKNAGEKIATPETAAQQVESSGNATVKTFIRKKIVKKVPVAKAVQKDNEGTLPEVEANKGAECSEDKAKEDSGSHNVAVVQDATVKATTKKKIIKRVPKRKVIGVQANDGVSDSKKVNEKDGNKVAQAGTETKSLEGQTLDATNLVSEAKSEKKTTPKTMSKSVTPDKQDDLVNTSKLGTKADKDNNKEEKKIGDRSGSASKIGAEIHKQKSSHKDDQSGKREKSKEREKSKDEEKKDKGGKEESRSKSNKDIKEKKQPEEPPRHPGLFLRTNWSNDSKLRSLSLSLDSLLDYSDKDLEESTFELSLFAESLYEMLQYQMGSRLLTFLQKLRIKFVMKRNQRKRQREDISKEKVESSSTKRVKTEDASMEEKSAKTETLDAAEKHDDESIVKEEDTSVDGAENVKPVEDETDDEDPEEDPEEMLDEDVKPDEEMLDASPQHELTNEEKPVEGKTVLDTESENLAENAKGKEQETAKGTSESKPVSGSESKEDVGKMETKKVEKQVPVDKELLQAFRFFDRNRVGYIRVEDMRLIIHTLGKFLSHRDVKELVQSALLESNTGRDDRILYHKLVRMSDL